MKIKINDIEVNAIVDNDIALTKSVNKMQFLSNRSGAFTTEIEAGLSSNNRQLTSNAQSTDSNTNFPYAVNKCDIEVNGYNVLTGFANLEETSDNYKIRAFGELANVFELIGDAKLQDLNLDYSNGTSINHIWNYANVIANRNNTWQSGFIYPNINYGKWHLNQVKAFWDDLYPSVFCKYLFLRIFNSIGYHVTGEFLNDALFEKSILPMVKIANTPQFVLDSYKVEGEINSTILVPVPNFYNITLENFTTNSSLQFKQVAFLPEVITCFFPANYGSITFELNFNVNWITVGTGAFMKIVLYKFTPSLGLTTFQVASVSNGTNAINFTDDGKTAADTYYFLQFEWGGIPTWELISFNWKVKYNSQNLTQGNLVYVNECLPEVSQKEFLETIINQYNLMIKIDSVNRTIDFSYFNSVYANKLNAIDLTSKLDTSDLPKISYLIDGYAQNNYLNYETDDNDNELRKSNTYGQGVLFCNNVNIDKSNDVFQSKFAPIVRIPCLKTPTTTQAYIQLWISEDNNQTFRTQSVKPRIAYINRGETFEIHGNDGEVGGGSGASNTGPSAGVYFQDMEFAGSLIPKYYRIVSDMLQNPIFIEAFFNIKVSDYNLIDFTRPIYLDTTIKGFGNIKGYFYCNEIKQFKINRYETTAIELIRI